MMKYKKLTFIVTTNVTSDEDNAEENRAEIARAIEGIDFPVSVKAKWVDC